MSPQDRQLKLNCKETSPSALLPLCALRLATANNSFLGFFLLTSDEQEAPQKGCTSLRLTSLLQAAGLTKCPSPRKTAAYQSVDLFA